MFDAQLCYVIVGSVLKLSLLLLVSYYTSKYESYEQSEDYNFCRPRVYLVLG